MVWRLTKDYNRLILNQAQVLQKEGIESSHIFPLHAAEVHDRRWAQKAMVSHLCCRYCRCGRARARGQEERYALTFGVMEQDPFLGQAARLSFPTRFIPSQVQDLATIFSPAGSAKVGQPVASRLSPSRPFLFLFQAG